MKEFNVFMFKFAYRMTKYHNKKFEKWCGIFDKYLERLKES